MRRSVWLGLLGSWLVACGGGDAAPVTDAHDRGAESEPESEPRLPATPIDREQARTIAIREARGAGIDPDGYRVVSIEQVDEGSFRGHWHVFFEVHPGPVPPGGHFGVYVDMQSGDARVMQGE